MAATSSKTRAESQRRQRDEQYLRTASVLPVSLTLEPVCYILAVGAGACLDASLSAVDIMGFCGLAGMSHMCIATMIAVRRLVWIPAKAYPVPRLVGVLRTTRGQAMRAGLLLWSMLVVWWIIVGLAVHAGLEMEFAATCAAGVGFWVLWSGALFAGAVRWRTLRRRARLYRIRHVPGRTMRTLQAGTVGANLRALSAKSRLARSDNTALVVRATIGESELLCRALPIDGDGHAGVTLHIVAMAPLLLTADGAARRLEAILLS